MMRKIRISWPIAGLSLAAAGLLLAGTLAHACDPPPSAAAASAAPMVLAMGGDGTPAPSEPQAPQAPRSPRSPEAAPEAPPTPSVGPSPMAMPAPPAEAFEQPEAPRRLLPRAWFGFGLQCDACSASNSQGDSSVVWVFGSRPRVYSVETGSPAARAGIQRGDVITHINGISLLTPKGGQLFGATRPGQVVRWTLLRDGRTRYAVARAAERPEQRYAFEDWKRQVKQLSEMSDMTQIREEIARLNARIEHFTLEREPRTQHRIELVQPLRVRQLRYAGVIGGAEVEVRGPGNVIVSESDSRNEVVINTGESVVVIRASDLSKELQKQIQKEVEKKREPR